MKVKNILFRAHLEGRGIVNFDSSDQKYLMKKTSESELYSNAANNIKLGKKIFTENANPEKGEGKLNYKMKISSDLLRNNIYQDDCEFVTSLAMYCDTILANFVASPMGLTRGYMFAPEKSTMRPTIKRKSCLTITDAIQTCNAKPYLEIYSRGGDTTIIKDENGNDTYQRSSTSLFNRENIGDIKYMASGNIDLKYLQLISADPLFDRLAINSDWCENGALFDLVMTNNYGENYGKNGYFASISKLYTERFAEKGILLSNKTTLTLIKHVLNGIFNININRANSYARLEKLEIKLIEENSKDLPFSDNGWITINSREDIEALNFEQVLFYEEADEELVMKTKTELNPPTELKKKSKKNNKLETDEVSED